MDFIPNSHDSVGDGNKIIYQDYIPTSNAITPEKQQGEKDGSQRSRLTNSKKRGKKSSGRAK